MHTHARTQRKTQTQPPTATAPPSHKIRAAHRNRSPVTQPIVTGFPKKRNETKRKETSAKPPGGQPPTPDPPLSHGIGSIPKPTNQATNLSTHLRQILWHTTVKVYGGHRITGAAPTANIIAHRSCLVGFFFFGSKIYCLTRCVWCRGDRLVADDVCIGSHRCVSFFPLCAFASITFLLVFHSYPWTSTTETLRIVGIIFLLFFYCFEMTEKKQKTAVFFFYSCFWYTHLPTYLTT